jgi:uncharacterized membrane protein YtjA (UPF0391 family)
MWRWVRRASVVLMVLGVVGFVGTLVGHLVGGDSDKYGRVGIPGSGSVTLPRGEVDVHYAVRLATNGGGGALTVPGLSFDLTPPEGAPDPVVTEDVGGTVTVNSSSHVRVWRMQVQEPGTYAVTTDGDVQGFIAPQLTFGKGSPVPAWPAAAFAVLFVVALALLLVSLVAGRPATTLAGPAPARTPGTPPYGGPTSTPSTTTPEQELARLTELQKLTELHTSGTLSDAEYDAARRRLG